MSSTVASWEASLICWCQRWLLQKLHWPVTVNEKLHWHVAGYEKLYWPVCCQRWLQKKLSWSVALKGGFQRSFTDLLLSTVASGESSLTCCCQPCFLETDLLLSTLVSREASLTCLLATMASREASLTFCSQRWLLQKHHWPVAVNVGFKKSFTNLLLATMASIEALLTF